MSEGIFTNCSECGRLIRSVPDVPQLWCRECAERAFPRKKFPAMHRILIGQGTVRDLIRMVRRNRELAELKHDPLCPVAGGAYFRLCRCHMAGTPIPKATILKGAKAEAEEFSGIRVDGRKVSIDEFREEQEVKSKGYRP